MKTLVILLAETRASEITYDNIKKNLIDELNADLALCISCKPDYDYENPFYKLAKMKFTIEEPEDFGDLFDKEFNEMNEKRLDIFEKCENMNTLYAKLNGPYEEKENIQLLGNYPKESDIDFEKNKHYEELVYHNNHYKDDKWRNLLYGIKNNNNNNYVACENVTTFKKPLHWREFLQIPDQFFGGVKNSHPGSAGILIYFRHFLLKKLLEYNLIFKYDRFIITRSDYLYKLPHPQLHLLDENNVWVPNEEFYGGITDRHTILSKCNIIPYLSLFNNMVVRSNEYFSKLKNSGEKYNLEKLIYFHLCQNNLGDKIKYIPYVMFTVRGKNGTTRWQPGWWVEEFGYHIKYWTEYNKSEEYKKCYEEGQIKDINEFYKEEIKKIN